MLAVSANIYLGLGHPPLSDLQSEKMPLLVSGLTELMRSDIPPDRDVFVCSNSPDVD
jgi:hypothetical protein